MKLTQMLLLLELLLLQLLLLHLFLPLFLQWFKHLQQQKQQLQQLQVPLGKTQVALSIGSEGQTRGFIYKGVKIVFM